MKKVFAAIALFAIALSAHAQWGGGYNNNGWGFGGGGYNNTYDSNRQMSGSQYGQNNALRAGTAMEVEIVSVRRVTIEPQANGWAQTAGAGAGGAMGAMLGNQVGKGNGKQIATVAGGIIGALGGAAAATPSVVEAQEIVIRKPGHSKMMVVVQQIKDGIYLQAGMRALAVEMGSEIRISPLSAPITQSNGSSALLD